MTKKISEKDELFYKELVLTNVYLKDIRRLLELQRKRYLKADLK